MSKPIKKNFSLKEFEKYVKAKDFGELPPTFIVIHHTWKPTVDDWNGKKTMDALDNYYRGLGWGGNGPHLFIAEDGIWLFTDMYDVGIHAGAGNGTLKSGYSIGIEVVGNYDNAVWEGETYDNTVGVIKILQEKLGIPDKEIAFHRDFSSKSCPGWAITKDWVLNQLNENEMSNPKYHTASSLTKENVKIWPDFKADVEESHKKMAGKLNAFIDEGEKNKVKIDNYETQVKDLTKEVSNQKVKVGEEKNKGIKNVEELKKVYAEDKVIALSKQKDEVEKTCKEEVSKVEQGYKTIIKELNKAHDKELLAAKEKNKETPLVVIPEEDSPVEETTNKNTVTNWPEWFKWAFRKVGIKTTDHEGM